jgi:hypothetical protein
MWARKKKVYGFGANSKGLRWENPQSIKKDTCTLKNRRTEMGGWRRNHKEREIHINKENIIEQALNSAISVLKGRSS